MQLTRYPGTKVKIAPEIIRHFPVVRGRYFEPFCGVLSVYFAAMKSGRLTPEQAVLSDSNPELINYITHLQTQPEALIAQLQHFDEEEYFKVRSAYNSREGTPLCRAAQFYYLQQCCFNGVYRVNAKGGYRVPPGDKVFKFDASSLRRHSQLLQNCQVLDKDFLHVLPQDLGESDFVYFDPPYWGQFNGYTAKKFSASSHLALRGLCEELTRRGVAWVQSNSDVPQVRSLYTGYHIEEISVTRNIAAKKSSRGVIIELLIKNK